LNALIVARKVTTPLIVPKREKNNNENSNMVSKADFKKPFQSSLKDMLTKKKEKNNDEGDDDSLDMDVFKNSWKLSNKCL
jgi:hypothetical protein